MYLPQKDEMLSRPGWLTYSGQFTHISGHPSAASKQASLFAQSTNKDITSMNNVQGQAATARKAHKAQHCWPPCKKI